MAEAESKNRTTAEKGPSAESRPAKTAGGPAGGGKQLNIDTILRDVKKNLFVIISLSIVAGLAAYVFFLRSYSPVYQVEMTYVVTSSGGNNSAIENLNTAANVADSYSRILNSSEMRKVIAADMGTGGVPGSISASIVEQTNLLRVQVTSDSPRTAFQIIRSISRNNKLIMSYLSESVRMSLLVGPSVPQGPANQSDAPRKAVMVLLGAFAALLAGFAALSYFKDTVRTTEDIQTKLGAESLGSLCHEERQKSRKNKKQQSMLITHPTVSFPYTEGVHKLGRKVRNAMHKRHAKTLLITSAGENEGKSTVAANLALSIAEHGKKVLLMDLDMRKPSLNKIFDVEDKEIDDIGRFLTGRSSGENLIRTLSEEKLYVIFNTKEYSQSTEMLSNGRLEKLFQYLKEHFDYILIDSSPMNIVADAEVIANYADASMVVVREHASAARAVNEVLDTLRDSKARPIGCVLNDTHTGVTSALGGYQYGSDYGYRYGSGYGRYYGRYYGKYGSDTSDSSAES